MGYEDERCVFDLVEVEEEIEDVAAVGGVEVAGGLVGENDRRPENKCPSQSDALLLAAGELDGVVVHARGESDGGEEVAGARQAVAVGRVVELPREQDVSSASVWG